MYLFSYIWLFHMLHYINFKLCIVYTRHLIWGRGFSVASCYISKASDLTVTVQCETEEGKLVIEKASRIFQRKIETLVTAITLHFVYWAYNTTIYNSLDILWPLSIETLREQNFYQNRRSWLWKYNNFSLRQLPQNSKQSNFFFFFFTFNCLI